MHVHLLVGLKNCFVTQCCDVNQGSDITPAKSDQPKGPVLSCQHTGGSGNGHQDLAMCDAGVVTPVYPTVPLPTMSAMPCFTVVTSTDFLEYKSEQWQSFLTPRALRIF